jgi:hypothetical protein
MDIESSVAPTEKLPTNKVYLTRVSNGFLVESKDKHYNGTESVYLDLDSAIESVKNSFNA